MILCDSGPLAAIIDRHHPERHRCMAALSLVNVDLLSTWPCITEAMNLLMTTGGPGDVQLLWSLIDSSTISIFDLNSVDRARMRQLMWQFTQHRMELADSSLIAIAERTGLSTALTLDPNFQVYSTVGGILTVIP